MTKFIIVTYIKNGKIESRAFSREDSTQGVELFEKVRSEGYEAYLYHRPLPTKHCKSKEAREATKAATQGFVNKKPPVADKDAAKGGRKAKQATQEDRAGSGSDAVDLG